MKNGPTRIGYFGIIVIAENAIKIYVSGIAASPASFFTSADIILHPPFQDEP